MIPTDNLFVILIGIFAVYGLLHAVSDFCEAASDLITKIKTLKKIYD